MTKNTVNQLERIFSNLVECCLALDELSQHLENFEDSNTKILVDSSISSLVGCNTLLGFILNPYYDDESVQ